MKNPPALPRRGGKSRAISAALAFLFLDASDALAQCALCRDAVAAAPAPLREAMNYAIIGLAFAPYFVAALAAWTLSPGLRARVRAGLRHLRFPGKETAS